MNIIAVEGIDASGKETQVAMLVEKLTDLGYKVATESFPRYDKPIGKVIRDWLDQKIELTTDSVHMLYEADRLDFSSEILDLTLQGYDFLILDRYTLSNLAFGAAKGMDVEWLLRLQDYVIPSQLTFLIHISAETSLSRRKDGRDRHEQDLELLDNASLSYSAVAHIENAIAIDGEQTAKSINDYMLREILRTFS